MANINDILKETRELIELKKMIADLDEKERSGISKIFNLKSKIIDHEKSLNDSYEIRNKMLSDYEKALKKVNEEGKKIHGNTKKAFNKELQLQQQLINNEEKIIKKLKTRQNILSGITKTIIAGDIANMSFMNSLKDFDAIVKQTSLYLGLSSANSDKLRSNFESAYVLASRMGGTTQDLSDIQKSFANETGRATILSGKQLNNILAIAKGTGIASNDAGNLAGKFELIGYNAQATMKYIQNVVDMSERVGVNTSNIMKILNNNFGKMQTYNFRNGVSGFSQLAIYGEKFKMDISSVLSSMDKSRGLEEVINMSANLQVLGGQFASLADPMAMLFESRNDPEAYAKRLNNMTRGMVAMKKSADGFSFELASPMARDMLDKAASALGVTTEELTKQAFRQREITEMRKQMLNLNLNKSQKEMIESLAKFDTKTGKFTVNVGSSVVALTSLTKNQLDSMKLEKESLEQRAKSAMSFDSVYKSTIEEFKAVLLPLMRGVNWTLNIIRPVVESITGLFDNQSPYIQSTAKVAGAIIMFTSVVPMFLKAVKGVRDSFSSVFSSKKNIADTVTGGGSSKSISKSLSIKGGLGAGAGVGLAGLGIGAGVGVAALGISTVAKSLENLSEEKVRLLRDITVSLTALGAVGAIAGAGVMYFGTSAGAVAAPLAAFGGALITVGAGVALVGVGIGAATAGIGVMGMGISQLIDSGVKGKDSLFQVASGILAINMALTSGIMGSLGLVSLASTLSMISLSANKAAIVGDAFSKIGSALTTSSSEIDKMEKLLNTIQNFDNKKSNILSQIGNVFDKPLKVSFDETSVNLVNNITLEIDGKKFIEELNLVKRLNIKTNEIIDGKSS